MATAAAPTEIPLAPKKRSMLPMLLIAVAAAAATGGGVYFMTRPAASSHGEQAGHGEQSDADAHGGSDHGNGHGASAAAHGAAQYLPLAPAIVVNLDDNVTMRYLSADIELMSRSNDGIEAAKLHMPRIRNTLMLLFTQQKYEDVVTRQGKESLQKAALASVQNVLKEETGKPGIEGLYFTNFVMQ